MADTVARRVEGTDGADKFSFCSDDETEEVEAVGIRGSEKAEKRLPCYIIQPYV